jgi:uncharacterized SAM-binding protein YcdF (DUF218 family)
MNAMLADATFALTFAIAPALLIVRFVRPRIMPRLALLILAAILGGTAFYIAARLQYAHTFRYLGPMAFPAPPEVDGMVVLAGPGRTEFMLGAMLQLGYLLLWLVPYGTTRILLDRRRRSHRVVA